MAHGRNKHQSRENRARVRRVFMDAWDPIGIRGMPGAQDEYDDYVGPVYVMLMDQRAWQRAIAAYLYDVATGHMGLSPHPELVARSVHTAALLVELRPSLETP